MIKNWGLSSHGFKAKTFEVIKDELETELRKTVDPNLRFTPDTIAGQITAIVANQTRQVWEMGVGVFASLDTNMAHGRALDALCALTGTYRRRAEHSRIPALLRLKGGAHLPKGSMAAVSTNTNARFKTVSEIKNDSPDEAVFETEMIADEVGSVYAKATSEWRILTPQADWLGITNTKDAILGRLDESDEELRLRRIKELRSPGSATHDAICAHLLAIHGVQSVHIEEGVNSFTAYVMGGDELQICQSLYRYKPLGVSTNGTVSHTVEASNGQIFKVNFSRPLLIPLSLHINLRVKERLSSDELVGLKTKILDYTQNHIKLGDEPYPSRLYPILFSHPKVLDAMSISLRRIGSSDTELNGIKAHELACFEHNQIFIEQVVA